MGLLRSLETILLRSPLEPPRNCPISFIRSFQSGLLAGFFLSCSSFSLFRLLTFRSPAISWLNIGQWIKTCIDENYNQWRATSLFLITYKCSQLKLQVKVSKEDGPWRWKYHFRLKGNRNATDILCMWKMNEIKGVPSPEPGGPGGGGGGAGGAGGGGGGAGTLAGVSSSSSNSSSDQSTCR